MPGGGPQRQVPARRVTGDDRTPGIGLRKRGRREAGQRIHRRSHIIESLGPPPRNGPLTTLVRKRTPAPVLHVGHGETAPGQEVGQRRHVLPVVRGAPRAPVQQDHQRRRGRFRGAPAPRRVEVDEVVGMVPVRGGGVRGDRRVGEGRGGLGGVPFDCGVRHRLNLSVTRGTAGLWDCGTAEQQNGGLMFRCSVFRVPCSGRAGPYQAGTCLSLGGLAHHRTTHGNERRRAGITPCPPPAVTFRHGITPKSPEGHPKM